MKQRLAILAGFAAAAAVLVVALERYDVRDGVTPAAAVHVVTDLTHDVDRVGLTITRVSVGEEMRAGDQIARRLSRRLEPSGLQTQQYLGHVGQRLTPLAARKGITYQFHLAPDTSLVNAFAVPGGHVFVGQGLLRLLESEAELAGVLSHEIEHVDQRHAIERLQYQLAARRLGFGDIATLLAELGAGLFQAGYQKDQELDADRLGVRMSAEAGYDPAAMARVLRRMQAQLAPFEVPARPKGPLRETVTVVTTSLEEYFSSHPRYEERIAQIERLSAAYPPRRWIENREAFAKAARSERKGR
jgi:predicted Zn-dependent protease